MRVLTCKLTFSDGKKVIATASARFENENVNVQYSGPFDRVHPIADKATLGFLEWYLRGLANNKNAEIEVTAEGEFEPAGFDGPLRLLLRFQMPADGVAPVAFRFESL